MSKKNTLKKN